MLFTRLSLALVSLALGGFTSLAAAAYAPPGGCTGTCNNAHDPSIVRRADGKYFRFSTGGLISIMTAPDITGPWTFACTMLRGKSNLEVPGNAGTDLWAPDVSLVGGTYYVYYSVSAFGRQVSRIGVATSATMECGSFVDHGSVGVSSTAGSEYNAIDANLLNDGGSYRLQFGSFWSNIYSVPMANPPTGIAGGPTHLSFDPAGTHAEEGSFMVKFSNYYYLFFSSGICCGYDRTKPPPGAEYKIKVCRSSSSSGGFVDQSGRSCTEGGGTVVLATHDNVYGPGGQSVYNDPKYGWLLVYHYVDPRRGYGDGAKQFGWNKINWIAGWPTV